MPFTPDDELLAELKAAFAVEAAEHLEALNRDLLALERAELPEERQGLLKEIFRAAHSLKGGASAVGLPEVRALAHHLESVFAAIQAGELEVDPVLFDVLYGSLDVIQRLSRADGSGDPADPAEVAAAGERLATVLQHADTAAPGDRPPAPREAATAPSEHGGPAAGPETAPAGGGETVRITVSKLDDLMTQVGELVVASAGAQRTAEEIAVIAQELGEAVRAGSARNGTGELGQDAAAYLPALLERVEGLRRWVAADSRRMDQVTNGLQEDIRRARMLPIASVFESFPRMVRDLARSQGKIVRLDIRGAETELDRAILEQIKAPLTHLLRNCVDHGLEDPASRSAAGKDPEGTIVLSALQQGDTVSIEVADDGGGIDVDRVKTTAVEKGGVRAEEVDEMGDKEALALIFRSGLSTSSFITSVSGRGVGMDVVRENVEALNGTIELETQPGRGTTFSLTMPLTVTTTRCLLVRSAGQTLGIPLTCVVRTIRISPDEVQEAEGSEALILPEGPLPLRDLAAVLGLPGEGWEDGHRPVVVARSANRAVGLRVDEILGIEEAVVKNLPPPLVRVRHAAGATILGTGAVVVILNPADVVRSAVRSTGAIGAAARRISADDEVETVKILLADDSITTRTLEKNILQSAGYEVRVAVDGADAWRAIQEELPDLVVSDVQMPGMDGFELTAMIRADERFRNVPVILVTSLESEADRERGMDVGADAYIGKSSFDQEQLLDAVRRLI